MRDLFGGIENTHGVIIKPRRLLRTATGHRRNLRQRCIGLAQGCRGIAASRLDKARGHALLVFQQRFEEMLRPNTLMAHTNGHGLRALQKTLGPVGEFLEVHALFPRLALLPRCEANATYMKNVVQHFRHTRRADAGAAMFLAAHGRTFLSQRLGYARLLREQTGMTRSRCGGEYDA